MNELGKLVADLSAKIDRHFSELKKLVESKQTIKDLYTTDEIAERLGKTPDTVREWCRTDRIESIKLKGTGRGGEEEWRVTHDGLEYYFNKGLKPLPRRRF